MGRLSKQEQLDCISAADSMFADMGMTDLVEKYHTRDSLTPTQYFNFAWRLWLKHCRRQVKRKRYQARHRQYLTSPEWKALRDARIEIDGGRCADCGHPAECVHHLHYRTWRREDIHSDLVSLCNSCHYARHFPKEPTE